MKRIFLYILLLFFSVSFTESHLLFLVAIENNIELIEGNEPTKDHKKENEKSETNERFQVKQKKHYFTSTITPIQSLYFLLVGIAEPYIKSTPLFPPFIKSSLSELGSYILSLF